jgi:hypothetical protein
MMLLLLLVLVGSTLVATQHASQGTSCDIGQFVGCLCQNSEIPTCVTALPQTDPAKLAMSGTAGFAVLAPVSGTKMVRTLCTKLPGSPYRWLPDPTECKQLLGFCLAGTSTRCCQPTGGCLLNQCASFAKCDDIPIGPVVPTPSTLFSPMTKGGFPTSIPTTTTTTTTTVATTTTTTVASGPTAIQPTVDTLTLMTPTTPKAPTTTTPTTTTTTITTTTSDDTTTTSDPYQLVATTTTATSISITSSDTSSDSTLYFILGAVGAAMLLLAVVVLIVVLVRGKSVTINVCLLSLYLYTQLFCRNNLHRLH